MNEKVYIVGHKNPDTDSICSAISYSYLKNEVDNCEYVPMRAGKVSPETQYVLDYFGFEAPALLEDLRSKIGDCNMDEAESALENDSLFEAWERLKAGKHDILTVLDDEDKLSGIITTGDLTKEFMKGCDENALARGKTPISNIEKVVNGYIVCGSGEKCITEGGISVFDTGAKLEGKFGVVILSNDEQMQRAVIESGAQCMIICLNAKIRDDIIAFAQENECAIISTALDAFSVSQLIIRSLPIKELMVTGDIKTVKEGDFVTDAKLQLSDINHRAFPVVDENGKLKGLITKGHLLEPNRKKVIMVDHNEKRQGVTGMGEADVVEILDHHKIGNINTVYPIFYRNRQVGCSCTIIYELYRENNIEIPEKIAGLMCSAILSDTLLFKSPTCTVVDKKAALELAEIANIDYQEYAMNMFSAGSDFGSKTAEEIFNLDFKKFQGGDVRYGVAQVSSVSRKELDELKRDLWVYMKQLQEESDDLDMLFLMLTDILNETTDFICVGDGATALAERAFGVAAYENSIMLSDTVSRKKQIIPVLSERMV